MQLKQTTTLKFWVLNIVKSIIAVGLLLTGVALASCSDNDKYIATEPENPILEAPVHPILPDNPINWIDRIRAASDMLSKIRIEYDLKAWGIWIKHYMTYLLLKYKDAFISDGI